MQMLEDVISKQNAESLLTDCKINDVYKEKIFGYKWMKNGRDLALVNPKNLEKKKCQGWEFIN